MEFDLLLKGATLFMPSGQIRADVGVIGDKIAQIGNLAESNAKKILELDGQIVLPGCIDTQVHFREPGLEHKEDLHTGTKSAALGGITSIFEMPNTKPPTTDLAALENKLNLASGRAFTNFAFFVGGCSEQKNWRELETHVGCAGIKIFMGSSTGSLLVDEDDQIEEIMRSSSHRIAIHCEDEALLKEKFPIAKEGGHPRFHPKWRDEEVAFKATSRALALARKTSSKVHILHVTTREEIDLIASYRDVATLEVTPQHLTLLGPDAYERLGTLAQMNPPIREKEHQDGLWSGIERGIVDVLGSDHAPHTLEEKSKEYPNSPSGMPGVQTLLPLMLNHVNQGRLSLLRLVDLLCYGPARIYGIPTKGRLSVGFDADITIIDMTRKHTIQNKNMASKCGWTPFHEMEIQGMPTHTIVGGHIVMQEGQIVGEPCGKAVDFHREK